MKMMKLKFEKNNGLNQLTITDFNIINKYEIINLSVKISDIELNLKGRKESNEKISGKNYIKVIKNPEQSEFNEKEIKYIYLNKFEIEPILIKLEILNYKIQFFIDKIKAIEDLKKRSQLLNNINKILQRFLSYIRNYFIIKSIEVIIKQNEVEVSIITQDSISKQKLIDFVNNIQNPWPRKKEINNLNEIGINMRFNNSVEIKLKFIKGSSFKKKYLKIFELMSNTDLIYINNSKCYFNGVNPETYLLFYNLDIVKELCKFRETSISEFFNEIRSLNFMNNSSDFKKILTIFNKMKNKLNKLNNEFQLFYL